MAALDAGVPWWLAVEAVATTELDHDDDGSTHVVDSGPLVHLRHPVDNLPCCGTDEPNAIETNDIERVTCDACLASLDADE